MLAICIPSRGLMHSRTAQDILANVLGKDELGFYFSHGNPIPKSHNIIIEEALEDDPDYIFLVEDDMALPYDILDKMLKVDADVAIANYPIGGLSCVKIENGKFKYAGVGCLLVKPWVFETLGEPYFRTNVGYQEDTMEPYENTNEDAHGLLDVDFWVRVKQIPKIDIQVVGEVGHYNLISPVIPKRGNNTALEYKVETLTL